MTAAQTFNYTGAQVTVTVPSDASVAVIECWGAQGYALGTAVGGKGGYAKGTLPVTPGDTLYVSVGGTNGFNGGGGTTGGGTAGGGASDVRVGDTGLAGRVIVAGGGGGAAGVIYANGTTVTATNGYDGGGLVGGGAYGGTQTAGGYEGNYQSGVSLGHAGALGVGGDAFGNSSNDPQIYGGGGGGGYYGGGGGNADTSPGGYGDPGGGGSSYLGGVTSGTTSTGVQTGNGKVVITWINNPPNAPTLQTPPNNGYVVVPPTLTWQPSDPDVGDAQTSADIQYRKSGDPTWTALTSAVTTATSYTFGAGVITAGSNYEWQVRTYDKTGTVGPWSGSFFFNAVTTPPAPTITAPAAGATLTDTPTVVAWTVPAGQTQTSYQVRRTDGGTTVYYDSGQVASTVTTANVPLDATFGRTDHIQVRYLSQVWSDWADVSIVSDAGPPQTPTLALVPQPDTATVLVQIGNPAAAGQYATAVSNDLYRTSPDGTRVRIATGLAVNASYTDWLPGAGVNTYQAVAFASNGAGSPLD